MAAAIASGDLESSLLNQEVGWVCRTIPEAHSFSLTTSGTYDQLLFGTNFFDRHGSITPAEFTMGVYRVFGNYTKVLLSFEGY